MLRHLAGSCHLGPTIAVTLLAGALATVTGLPPERTLVLAAAVFCGQLTIGWGNDLLDLPRDRAAGRGDKPLTDGRLRPGAVRVAIGCAVLGMLLCSLPFGYRSAFVHIVLVVGSGWAYNLWLKRTLASFVPYAVAFGALPGVITLATNPPACPPGWLVVAGALLGVGAHALNVLPDLDDDAATGVRGLPHALGERGLRLLAASSLFGGVLATVTGSGMSLPVALVTITVAAALGLTTVRAHGRAPFLAAIGIALLLVAALLLGA